MTGDPFRAHAALVCTLEWYREALADAGRIETAHHLRGVSASLIRNAPRRPGTAGAIEALGHAVRELAKPTPDHNKLVALLHDVADEAEDVHGVLDSVKAIIAVLARSDSGGTAATA